MLFIAEWCIRVLNLKKTHKRTGSVLSYWGLHITIYCLNVEAEFHCKRKPQTNLNKQKLSLPCVMYLISTDANIHEHSVIYTQTEHQRSRAVKAILVWSQWSKIL